DAVLFVTYTLSLHDALPISSLGEIETLGVLAGGLDAVLERPLDEARFLAALQEVLARRKLLTSSSIRDIAQTISNREPSVELARSEEHTSELQSRFDLVCRL